jgi:hypothetical protein
MDWCWLFTSFLVAPAVKADNNNRQQQQPPTTTANNRQQQQQQPLNKLDLPASVPSERGEPCSVFLQLSAVPSKSSEPLAVPSNQVSLQTCLNLCHLSQVSLHVCHPSQVSHGLCHLLYHPAQVSLQLRHPRVSQVSLQRCYPS